MKTNTIDLMIQKNSKKAQGFVNELHSPSTADVSRSFELEQSPVVEIANAGDSLTAILKYYTKPFGSRAAAICGRQASNPK